MIRLPLLSSACVLAFASQASAEVIVLYDMQDPDAGSTTSAQTTADQTATGVTASALSFTSLNQIRDYTSGSIGSGFDGDLLAIQSLNDADGDDDILTASFTLTVAPGLSLDLDGFSLASGSNRPGASGSLLINGATVATYAVADLRDNNPDATDQSDVLSLSGLTGTIDVVFQYEVRDGRDGFFDDIQLTGTVIPEPASLALLGLGGLMLLPRRRA